MSRKEDYLCSVDKLDWHSLGSGAYFKLLRYNEDSGQFVIILRLDAGGTFMDHKHYGPAEFLMLKGKMHYTDQTAVAGDYGYEAMYAVHDATNVTEDTEMLFIGYGPVIFEGEDGRPDMILDGELLNNIANGNQAPVSFTA